MSRVARWAWLALLLPAPGLAEGPPRCRVQVSLDPPHAYVGQQVLYDLRILRRRDVSEQRWERALTFPTFRAEWLPGRAGDAPVERDGEAYLAYHERRALFPAHAGRLEVPGASLRCVASDGEEIVAIPAAHLDVAPLPEAGQPPGFDGLVGRVWLTATVSPRQLRVGESLRVSLLAKGPANLWNAAPMTEALRALPAVEVFEQPAETARDAGQSLLVRRYFGFDLVPHEPGPLDVPELAVTWFDPATARYQVARTGSVRVEVLPRAASAAAGEAQGGPPALPATPARDGVRFGWLAALVLVGALAAVAWRLRARRHQDGFARVETLVDEAQRARERGALEEAAAKAGNALRAALGRAEPDAQTLAAEELRVRSEDGSGAAEAALWLERLEHARFAGDAAALRSVLDAPGWVSAVRALRHGERLLDSAG